LVEAAFGFNIAGVLLSMCDHWAVGSKGENNFALLVVRQTNRGESRRNSPHRVKHSNTPTFFGAAPCPLSAGD